MNTGILDSQITIQSPVTQDDGAGGFVETWADVATVWGRRVHASGREGRAASQLVAEADSVFTLRTYEGLTSGHRFACDGIIYDLLVVPPADRSGYVTIQAKARADR